MPFPVSKHICIERKNCQPQPVKTEGHWKMTIQGYNLNDPTYCPYCGQPLEQPAGQPMTSYVVPTGSASGEIK